MGFQHSPQVNFINLCLELDDPNKFIFAVSLQTLTYYLTIGKDTETYLIPKYVAV